MFKQISHGLRRQLVEARPNDLLRIYSLQHPAAAESAAVRGYWTGDSDYVDDIDEDGYNHGYRSQYDWMRQQMAERVPEYSGDYPIWGSFYRRNMRQQRYYPEGIVELIADVPRQRVLISDYDRWHSPLNNWYCSDTEDEDDRYSALQDPNPANPARIDDEMRESWKRIFDIQWRTDRPTIEWSGQCWVLQACVDRIYTDEIVSQHLTNGRKGRNGGSTWK